jgi:hypothetical protein
MEVWIGPAIVAALVSALVSAAGWFVSTWQAQRRDQMRRDEKVHDFQIALRAEIASDLIILEVPDRQAFLDEVSARYKADLTYSPIIPTLSRNVVFEAIVGDIPILPGDVITPVIHYARMRQTLDQFIDDMRAPGFSQLSAERQLIMYSDYLEMQGRLEVLARKALQELDSSLSSSGAVLPTLASASGAQSVSASAGRKASP